MSAGWLLLVYNVSNLVNETSNVSWLVAVSYWYSMSAISSLRHTMSAISLMVAIGIQCQLVGYW